ncbi:MAG: restriction endonuclease subunit S [Clostridia bacterium]|nr:restriction endonuclease subunit S [Clostridia bacterium]
MVKEWETTTIGEYLDFKNGLNKGKEFFGTGTPIVNYMDVYKKRGLHASDLKGRVALSKDEIKRFEVQKGDVFFTRTSETPDEIGYASVMLDDVIDCVFSGFLLRGRPKNEMFILEYCQYAFFATEIRKFIMASCTYTTRALTNGRQLSQIELRVPPLPEQRAIASALSDADKYVTSLENLIAKKRAIKQGAMQELLTGKRRLPGFNGEWVERPLCKIADDIVMGQSPDSQYYNIERIGLPLVQGNADIKDRVTIIRSFTSEITKQGNKDDIIMTVRAPVGNVAKTDFECCLGRGVCAIKGNDFIYQLLIYFEPRWEAMSTGSTFDSISGNELREVKFNIPTSKSEQTAIAAVLFDMDAEIDALTAKLEKARHIKQGMMSELLTGRIRLIKEETDNGENKRNGAEDAKPCNCLVPGQSNSWV